MTTPRNRGQAIIEMAVVVVLLFFLVMGIIEFGRAFMITNMITHAARDGARFGATLDPTLRDNTTKCINGAGKTTITNHVNDQLKNVGVTDGAVDVVQTCDGTVPIVKVAISGTIPYIFNLVGSSGFGYNRSVTFQDESRKCPGACA